MATAPRLRPEMYLQGTVEVPWQEGVIRDKYQKKKIPLSLHTCMMDLTQMSGAERGETFLLFL